MPNVSLEYLQVANIGHSTLPSYILQFPPHVQVHMKRREANLMRTCRHIDVNHYALDNQGRAVHLTPFPNALEGTHANTKVPFIHVGEQD